MNGQMLHFVGSAVRMHKADIENGNTIVRQKGVKARRDKKHAILITMKTQKAMRGTQSMNVQPKNKGAIPTCAGDKIHCKTSTWWKRKAVGSKSRNAAYFISV